MIHRDRFERWATSRWPSAILIALFALWGAQNLSGFSWSWDEGVILMTGRTLAQGYALYDPLWYNYPPLMAQLLALAFRMAQTPTLLVGRGLALGFGLLLLASTAQLSWTIWRDGLLALAATALMVFSWPFLANSRNVQADVPALGLAVLSLALTARADSTSPPWRYGIAGGLLAASLACKPTSGYVLLPIIWPLLRDLRRRWRQLAALAMGGIVVLGLSLATVNLGAFWQQFAGSLASQPQAIGARLAKNLGLIWQLLTYAKYGPPQYLLPALCLVGLWAMTSESSSTRWMMAGWLGAGLLIWVFYSPLYSHHLVTLLPALVILAALGLRRVARWGHARCKGSALTWMTLASLAVVIFGLASMRWATAPIARPNEDDEDRDALVAAERIQATLLPNDWIVTDSLSLAFAAQRNVPPEMVNLSSWRIRSGNLSATQAIAWTEQYQPQAVVFWDDRLEGLTDFVAWVRANYYLTEWYGKERRIYQPGVAPEQKMQVRFESLWLDGYVLRAPSQQDDTLALSVYWRATSTPGHATTEVEWVAFDDQGQAHPLLKTRLAEGEMRPSHWIDGDRVICTYHLPLDDLRPGSYALHLTMHHGPDIIPAESSEGIAESVPLTTWQIR